MKTLLKEHLNEDLVKKIGVKSCSGSLRGFSYLYNTKEDTFSEEEVRKLVNVFIKLGIRNIYNDSFNDFTHFWATRDFTIKL